MKKPLRTVYDDMMIQERTFQELLQFSKSVSVHHNLNWRAVQNS